MTDEHLHQDGETMPSEEKEQVNKIWKTVALISVGLAGGGGGSTAIFSRDVAANENRITKIEQKIEMNERSIHEQSSTSTQILDLRERIIRMESDISYMRKQWEGCGPAQFNALLDRKETHK